MTQYRIYYETSGKIYGHDNGAINDPLMRPDGCFVLSGYIPDETTYSVDITSLKIRQMTLDERRRFNAPNIIVLRIFRDAELRQTDWRDSQPEWAAYRQAMRDITKLSNEVEMVDNWPLRPDGTDAVAHIKEKMNGVTASL